MNDETQQPLRSAMERLGVDRFLLGIHDASFPCDADEDLGRGSPGSRAGRRLLALAARLGFTGLQLGPSGLVSDGNASPYDGAHFSRDFLSIPLAALAGERDLGRLVATSSIDRAVADRPAGSADRTSHRYAFAAMGGLLDEAFRSFRAAPRGLATELAAWSRANVMWLERDGLFESLRRLHLGEDWQRWSGTAEADLDRVLLAPPPSLAAAAARRRAALCEVARVTLDRHSFVQWLVHREHAETRRHARALGLALFGDLQIGFSRRDEWAAQHLLLATYRLGAPPSRTTPEGQPWGYPVLDPRALEPAPGGTALAWLMQRVEKMLDEFDGVRVDHPHGYVCPWVYRSDDPDALRAVRAGARLFESPSLPDHPDLARYARVAERDLNPNPQVTRYADDWVVQLSPAQVERYAVVFDRLVELARAYGRDASSLVCEVLSTLPRPLAEVLRRHGLGRFRVVQKADPRNPHDVYHVMDARAGDWVMLGNHDTRPIWVAIEGWHAEGRFEPWCRRLAARLAVDPAQRDRLAHWLAEDDGLVAHAAFAELLESPARNVMLFFADLFGLRESYNTPGTISDRNWSLRLTPDFEERYRAARADGRALDLSFAAGLALRMRGARDASTLALLAQLDGASLAPWRWPRSRG